MKILCITPVKHLDGAYEKLESYGDVIYKPNITKQELKILLDEFNPGYLFTNPNKQNFILDKEVLEGSYLKVINTCSTGLNHIDLDYCKENGIVVWSLKEDYELINDLPSTSELAFGLMMSLLRNIPKSFHSVRDGNWDYEPYVGHQIKGKTIGVIGYGRLGKIMCRLFDGWGVDTFVYDPYTDVDVEKDFEVDLDELLEKSDVVFLHTHVTDETRGMVDDEFLSKMKQGSYLVNTARGELVDEDSIIKSIEQGHLKGYGTDVIRDEFGNREKSKLVEFSINPNNNVVITPHIGGMTIEGQTKAYTWAIGKFKSKLWRKKPPNVFWLQDLQRYTISPTPGYVLKKWGFKGWEWPGPYYSDDGEDGILEYLFNHINDKNKFAVDIGSAHGYGGSNIRYLADKYDWKTTEFDGSNKWSNIHPRVKNLRITPKNICSELLKCETPYQIDLLSLDIDSMDWYVLKSVLEGGFESSVIILEYNPIFNFDDDVVRTYSAKYKKDGKSGYGASLSAFEKLLNKHNYRLVTNCADPDNEIYSNNAIFLNNKFIREPDRIQTIEELHPKIWKEPWKENKVSNLTDLKEYLIEKNIMRELKEEDYEVN